MDADSAFVLWVEKSDYVDLEVKHRFPEWDFHQFTGVVVPSLLGFYNLTADPRRTQEGIALEYPSRCSGDFFKEYVSAVWVPANPEIGDIYQRYECGNLVVDRHEVVAVDQTVTVPAGTFEEVFVLRKTGLLLPGPDKQYWSEKAGLVKIEKFYEDGSLLGTYELTSSTF